MNEWNRSVAESLGVEFNNDHILFVEFCGANKRHN